MVMFVLVKLGRLFFSMFQPMSQVKQKLACPKVKHDSNHGSHSIAINLRSVDHHFPFETKNTVSQPMSCSGPISNAFDVLGWLLAHQPLGSCCFVFEQRRLGIIWLWVS